MNDMDRAWLAGLLEGEGYFAINTYERRTTRQTPSMVLKVTLQMTDQDVVERAAVLMGGGGDIREIPPRRPNHSPIFRFQVCGRAANILMREIYPLMGSRRKSQIDRVLAMRSQHDFEHGRPPQHFNETLPSALRRG